MSHVNIILDKTSVYNPDEIISGKVTAVLDEPQLVRELKISFIGQARISWMRGMFSDTTSLLPIPITVEQILFSTKTTLWPTDGETTRDFVTMQAGKYEFDFSFRIPTTTWKFDTSSQIIPKRTSTVVPLPGTLSVNDPLSDSVSGAIRYFLEARIVRPMLHIDQTHHQLVSIRGVYDLNTDPTASLPIAIADGKTICSWRCACGRIEVSINLPKTGYALGEHIVVSAKIANHSTTTIKKVRLELFQVCEFRDLLGEEQVVEDSAIAETNTYDPVLPGQTQLWKEGFPIPLSARPSMAAEVCRIIEIKHHLVMKLVLKGCWSNLKVHIPVRIGTISLTTPAPDPPSLPFDQVEFK